MIFLKSSNFIGVHSRKGVSKIVFEKRMTILTGYNGAGKSTILSGIFLTLDGIGQRVQRPLFFARKDWGIELNLIDNNFYELYKNKFKDINLPQTNLNINIKNLITKPYSIDRVQQVSQKVTGKEKLGLYDFYNFIDSELKKGDENTSKNLVRVENSTNIFTINVTPEKPPLFDINKVLAFYNNDLQGSNGKVSVAFYKDEQFYHSKNLDNTNDLNGLDVFSKNNNLDKSIFLLLSEFRGRVFTSDQVLSEDVAHEFLLNKNDIDSYSNDQLKSFFQKLIATKRFTKDVLFFVDKLNLFFKQINKTAYLEDDGLIYFKEIINKKDETIENIVQWFDCSKGEKSLICLLLIVFLYRDTNTIYVFDEPDLAMHIEWQKILLPTFLDIAPKSQFIISTHSPALIPRDISDVGFINITKLKKQVEFDSE